MQKEQRGPKLCTHPWLMRVSTQMQRGHERAQKLRAIKLLEHKVNFKTENTNRKKNISIMIKRPIL